MRHRGLAVLALALVAVTIGVLRPSGRTSPPGAVGHAAGMVAPDFHLTTADGKAVSLSALRGKVVLINFWATYCAPCRIELPWLVELDKRYRSRGLEIVGISMDDPGNERAVAAFAHERNVSYTVLLGDTAAADAYGGVRLLPETFFIDRQGTIAKTFIGLSDKKDLEESIQVLLR